MYHVLISFRFPRKIKLDVGWKMWMVGLPCYKSSDNDGSSKLSPICPFRLLKAEMLPMAIRGDF